ncbi:MAG TPA: alpha-2-macroglobulin family protein, partial [Cytophaga sp.]|nr:alpha-2-macroglobulin family protein [Cytophaga sp.]
FIMLLGSGVAGQQRFDVSTNNQGVMIPVGVSVKCWIPYTESVRLEVLWNKTIFGSDYSYSNQGIWEINLRINFSLQRSRVICPSNFWGTESDERAKSNSSNLLLSSSTTTGITYSDTTEFVVANYQEQSVTMNDNVTYEKVRSDFYDRAYWAPSFKTDVNGNAIFNARYPDALTHWDNYIIAYSKHRQSNTWLSQNTAYLQNYVQLYVPRFVIGGDSASASYHVESDKPFFIHNTVGNATVEESNAADGNYTFYATAVADTISCKSLLFVDGRQSDGEQRLIPVYRAGNETYTGFYTYLSGDTVLNVSKRDSVFETKIYLSTDLQDLVRIQYNQLMDYNYSCNEQTASKLIGSIAGKQLNGTYGGNHPQHFYHKLKLNANADGLYSWWGSGTPNLSMSAYVLYALHHYYAWAAIKPDLFYTRLQRQLVESAAYYKANYFTYWLMKESNLSMDAIELASFEPRNYQEEILKLRIRQLQGDTIQRREIEKYVEKTTLGNVALAGSVQFEAAWYEHDALYLIILHRIAKSNYPDLAEQIRKGLIEHGDLSEYAPTYVKALFIEEFSQLNLIEKNVAAVTYDNTAVTDFPFEKVIKDNNSHIVKIDDAAGMYVVKSDKQIRTSALKYKGLDIEYAFEQDGQKISTLQSGTVVDQIARLNVSENCSYVMVEIPMAAGCIVEDVIVPGSAMLTHREVFRDKIILYFAQLPKGAYIVKVRQKVLFKGNYQLNPCSVNLMYFPMIQAQTAVRRIKIQ